MKNNKFKNLKFLAILLFTFILTGCASIDHVFIVGSNGKIEDRVVVELNTTQISLAGYDLDKIVTQITRDLNDYHLKQAHNFKLQTPTNPKLSNEQKLNVLQNIKTIVSVSKNKETIVSSLLFENKTSYDLFNSWVKDQQPPTTPGDDDEKPQQNINFKSGFLINTYVQKFSDGYGDITQTQLFQKYYNAPTLNQPNTFNLKEHFNLSQLEISRIYASTNTRLHSNAGITQTQNGVKMHHWSINPTAQHQPLEFYIYQPNTTNWYLLALAISLTVAIVLVATGIYKSKNKFKQKVTFN